jgi:hypothetical protein
MIATSSSAIGEAAKTGNIRATRYTPATTIVAAWIRAETGVGPAMASGSQTCSGIWADLPIAPQNSRTAPAVTTAGAMSPSPTASKMPPMLNVPAAKNSTKMPIVNPTSPTRVVRKAFIAAFEFGLSSNQCPIRK